MNKLITNDTWDKAQFTIPGGGTYVSPATTMVCVETEGAFCGSIFEPDDQHDGAGLTIEEHEFANSGLDYEVGAPQNSDGTTGDWEWDNFKK